MVPNRLSSTRLSDAAVRVFLALKKNRPDWNPSLSQICADSTKTKKTVIKCLAELSSYDMIIRAQIEGQQGLATVVVSSDLWDWDRLTIYTSEEDPTSVNVPDGGVEDTPEEVEEIHSHNTMHNTTSHNNNIKGDVVEEIHQDKPKTSDLSVYIDGLKEYWNENCGPHPKCMVFSAGVRKAAIRRFKEQPDIDYWHKTIVRFANCDPLFIGSSWIHLSWIFGSGKDGIENHVKINQGNYDVSKKPLAAVGMGEVVGQRPDVFGPLPKTRQEREADEARDRGDGQESRDGSNGNVLKSPSTLQTSP